MPAQPNLIGKALAKALDVENRLNALVPSIGPSPSIMYTSGVTVVTQSANGSYTWTCPAGVTSAMIECWGAGAGGDGGSSGAGGAGGGGGEYAAEATYAVVPGQVYNYQVGNGGAGGTSGNDSSDGGDTNFDLGSTNTSGVYAFGGSGSADGVTGGQGGVGSANSVEFAGGPGGNTSSTGASGGGSSASPTAIGNNGTNAASTTGTAGGAGGTDEGAGGAGGNAAANGVTGSGPGGGGGGAGAASGVSQFSKDYQPTSSGSYFGSDATGGNANQRKNYSGNGDGTLWQGGETASGGSYNGTQKSLFILPSSVQSDLAGATIDKILLRLLNQGSWYDSGAVTVLGYTPFTSLGNSWNGSSITTIKQYWVKQDVQFVADLTSTALGAALISGAATSLSLGPGNSFELNNYAHFWGASSNTGKAPDLHIEWHTGAAPVKAGSGQDGQVRITYTTAGTLVGAVQPAAGTDTSGNDFAAGYTGPAQAIQPASSPSNVETWNAFVPPTGWAGTSRYKLLAETGQVFIDITLGASAQGSKSNFPFPNALPAAYRPLVNTTLHLIESNNTSITSPIPSLFINASTGIVTAFHIDVGTTTMDIHAPYFVT